MRPSWLAVGVALASVSVLLAGCSSTPAPATSSSPPAPVAEVPFVATTSLISTSDGAGEPSMGVTPGGVLFTDLASDVYVSTDNGTTWTNTGNHQVVVNADPDLAVDVDGTVWESRDWLGCVGVAVSRDGGKTWTQNPAACPGTVLDRQYVIPTTGGTAYLYAHQLGTFQQLAVKTTDYGATWVPTTPPEGAMPHHLLVNGGTGWGGGGFWNAKTGSVFFTYTQHVGDEVGATGAFEYAGYTSTKDGLTWNPGTAAQLDGPSIGLGLVTGAADDAGNVYVTWGEAGGPAGKGVGIFLAASKDDGATWLPKVRVDAGNNSKVFPIAAAGQAGRVAVAYYEGDRAAYPDAMSGDWNVTLAWTEDALSANATWHHAVLATGVKHGPICVSGTTCSGNREFDDYFDLVRMPDGRVAATYNVLQQGGLRNGFAITSQDLLGAVAAKATTA